MKWVEIKPVAFFLLRFVAFYLIANLIYGFWVTSFEPKPDPVTRAVTKMAAEALHAFGYDTSTATNPEKATERLFLGDRSILAVFEGCNGINVWIIFTAFLFAFEIFHRRVFIFWLIGTVVIFVANLVRIIMLFFTAIKFPNALYFLHKYLFTAVIYLVVFALWYYWLNYSRNVSDKR